VSFQLHTICDRCKRVDSEPIAKVVAVPQKPPDNWAIITIFRGGAEERWMVCYDCKKRVIDALGPA